MAETTRIIPETGLADRYTGREADEFSVDSDLSLEEKLQRFEEAEATFMEADRYLEAGANKVPIYGSFEDAAEAKTMLDESADHFAAQFTEAELEQVKAEGSVPDYVVAQIESRRAGLEQSRSRLSDEYRQEIARGDKSEPIWSDEPDSEQSRDKSDGLEK